MNPEEYETMFAVEDAHWWYRGLRSLLREEWQRCGGAEHADVLDVGCGTGANMEFMRRFARPVGLDVSRAALEKCRLRSMTQLALADAADLPFPDAVFDAVLMMDLLYHRDVPDKLLPLREGHRTLRPGGLLFLNVPAYQWLYSSHDTAIHGDKRFSRAEVKRLLLAAGFHVRRLRYWNSVLLPPIALLRAWRKMRPRDGSDTSESAQGSLGGVFGAILALERAVAHAIPLPLGLSIFAVGQKN